MQLNKYQHQMERERHHQEERDRREKTIGGVLSSCTSGTKVWYYHRLMLALNAMGHVGVILHTRGRVTMVGTNNRPIKAGQKGDAFLPRISWEIELLHEISLKKKPTIVYPMNNPWYVTMSTATTLRITLDGVLGDWLSLKKGGSKSCIMTSMVRRDLLILGYSALRESWSK